MICDEINVHTSKEAIPEIFLKECDLILSPRELVAIQNVSGKAYVELCVFLCCLEI